MPEDSAVTVELEFVYELRAALSPAVDIGPTPAGFRRIIPIVSGRFEGPVLRGSVLPGGADWQIIRSDGVTELHAHYVLSTDDGVLIQVNVRGLRHAQGEILQRIAAGEEIDPKQYYFRIAPVFEAPEGTYAWLNRSVFIGTGARSATGVTLSVYRVV